MDQLPTLFDRNFNRPGFRDLRRMEKQMNRFLRNFFDTEDTGMMESLPANVSSFTPACEISEDDTHYFLGFDLPGVKKEDIHVDLKDRTLVVSGERKWEKREEKKGYFHAESSYGSFERSFELPKEVKADQIGAEFQNGVLRLTLPKAAPVQTRRIAIGESAKENPNQTH